MADSSDKSAAEGPSGNGYAEHDDNPVKGKATIDIDVLAESIPYGPSGVRGIFSSGPYMLSAAFLASLGGFSFGYDQGVMGIINVLPQFHAVIPEAENEFNKGFMTGMLLLGAFIGCWFYPYISDRWSRKKALLLSSIIFCIGGVIQTAAYNYATVVVGRTIGGIGTGTLALGAPMYISEVSPPHLRGTLLVLESVAIVGGVTIAYWITYACKDITGEASWRVPFALQLPSAMILGAMIQLFPYSPRWLAMQDRHEDCLSSLCKLRKLPASDERVQAEYQGILAEAKFQAVMLERRHPGVRGFKLEVVQWLDLFTVKSWRRTIVGAGVSFFQQFQGVNGFIYYAPTLFRNIGQSDDMSLILSGIFNALQIVGVFIAFILIDRVGRRPLAIYGGIGNMICFVVIAALVGTFDSRWGENTSAGWACVAMAFLFIIIFGASYSSLGWALPPEVFPNGMRSKGVAFSVAVNWLSNFTVGVVTPPMIESIGFGTYVFFACFCGLAAVWAFFLVPETMGKTLEQMDEAFGDLSGHEEQEVMREILGSQAN
ncbi:Sugar transporter STL1 [Colletotrichum aenigma]|uniref:Sugar transporter STL1 n=1 Tax=Colletotrichum aenigma TaxID=1215731 RepID=UPI001872998C|nr:Sugar transporter STL1 [Colletotrichum aenigma]KAF5525678.1 Sugar transporter STL1 [Colletotrichum aenigma]